MTDQEACEFFSREIERAGGDPARQHQNGDDVLRQVLREHGFPQLAKLRAGAAAGWWYE